MAYTLRVYAPVVSGLIKVSGLWQAASGIQTGEGVPQGNGVPAITATNVVGQVLLGSEWQNMSPLPTYRWIINVDGVVGAQENFNCNYTATGAESQVWIRLEVPDLFAELVFDLNDGSGTWASLHGSGYANAPAKNLYAFTIPQATPVRDGYVFKGWEIGIGGQTVVARQGDNILLPLGSASTKYTATAKWEKVKSEGAAWISPTTDAAPEKYIPYICPENGAAPVAYIPYIHDGTDWKEGV